MTTHLSSISAFVPVTWFGSRVESHLSNGQILRKSCDFEYKLRPNQKAAFDLLDGHIENSISL